MKICIVGATGLVGGEMVKVLEEFDLGPHEFYPVASDRSLGKTVRFRGKDHKVIGLEEAVSRKAEIAIFSAGAAVSRPGARIKIFH
jgi:aspartate-semialdehyde dehydrogenase